MAITMYQYLKNKANAKITAIVSIPPKIAHLDRPN